MIDGNGVRHAWNCACRQRFEKEKVVFDGGDEMSHDIGTSRW